MKIIQAHAPGSKVVVEKTNLHQWAEGDIILVRFRPENTNLQQNELYHDSESKSMRRRLQRSEDWIWYAGKVKRVNAAGDIYVKFFDDDTRNLSAADTRTEAKRTTKERLKKIKGKKKYVGAITNKEMVMLTAPLAPRGLEKVIEVDEESFAADLTNPVAKMSVAIKDVNQAYEDHEWLGSWVMTPIYDAYKKQYSLPAVIVGFGMVRGKHSLLLKADTSEVEHFKTPWAVMEVFDRSPDVLYEKLDRLVKSAKAKVNRERVTPKELLTLRREAKRSKRFI